MIFTIFKYSLASFILIFLLHNLFCYFQNTLTTPKVRDLVLNTQKTHNDIILINKLTEDKNIEKNNMKTELSTFLDELKNK